jgi:type II secretory pathway predicted ATPase ExeA
MSNRGFTAMIAPPGMGKTTLLFRFLDDIRETSRSIFLFDIDPACEPRDLVGYILRDLGITPGKTSSEMHEQLSDALIKETRAGRKFVLVIDEAQNLSDAALERVRLLTNFETSRGKLMQIVLSGQPQLSDKLKKPSLVQLRQRISTICRLKPLSAQETDGYIDYRLKQAGYEGKPLFASDALKMITETSQGTPRIINNLCFNALSLCRALNRKQVDAEMVSEAIADLQLISRLHEPTAVVVGKVAERPPRRPANRLRWQWAPVAAVLVFICLSISVVLSEFRLPQTSKSSGNRIQNLNPPSVSIAAAATEKVNEPIDAKPAINSKPFKVTVERDQNLKDIAVQYLGSYDLKSLHQIQALNPKMTDPNRIEAGQRIWLPGTSPELLARNTALPVNERKLP